MELMKVIITEVDEKLTRRIHQHRSEELPTLKPLEIKILGQMSLMMDPIGATLNPASTRDVDALVIGDMLAVNIFREVLKSKGLVYDELSKEIWLPERATFLPFHSSEYLSVSYLDPISALTSKAVKAKEKNRFLVKRGLELFGQELQKEIVRYGGDITYFKQRRLEL